jgi:hypothetical protein
VQTWRAFAKDGALLPTHQATTGRAAVVLGPGETYDYELSSPTPANLVLEVLTSMRGAKPATARVPVEIR